MGRRESVPDCYLAAPRNVGYHLGRVYMLQNTRPKNMHSKPAGQDPAEGAASRDSLTVQLGKEIFRSVPLYSSCATCSMKQPGLLDVDLIGIFP